MPRILAIDYGQKRIGVAVTDPLQLIANGLTTVETPKIYSFLAEYFAKEDVETIVVGYPKTLQNEPAEVTKYINTFGFITIRTCYYRHYRGCFHSP